MKANRTLSLSTFWSVPAWNTLLSLHYFGLIGCTHISNSSPVTPPLSYPLRHTPPFTSNLSLSSRSTIDTLLMNRIRKETPSFEQTHRGGRFKSVQTDPQWRRLWHAWKDETSIQKYRLLSTLFAKSLLTTSSFRRTRQLFPHDISPRVRSANAKRRACNRLSWRELNFSFVGVDRLLLAQLMARLPGRPG
jgi:hypothetical protein